MTMVWQQSAANELGAAVDYSIYPPNLLLFRYAQVKAEAHSLKRFWKTACMVIKCPPADSCLCYI